MEKKQTRMYGVLSHYIDSIWPDVLPLIEKAIPYCDGEYTANDIYLGLIERDMQLWVAFNNSGLLSCCVTEIRKSKTRKTLILLFAAGKDYDQWLNFLEEFKKFAKEHHCHDIKFYGRAGWEKLVKPFGFEKVYTVFKCEIE